MLVIILGASACSTSPEPTEVAVPQSDGEMDDDESDTPDDEYVASAAPVAAPSVDPALVVSSRRWEHGSPVDEQTVMLWTPRRDAEAALLELGTSEVEVLDLEELSFPLQMAARPGPVIWALERDGDAVDLRRREGATGPFESVATWQIDEYSLPTGEMQAHDGGVALAVKEDEHWSVVAVSDDGETDVLYRGLEHQPVEWGDGVVVDSTHRIRLDEEIWYWSRGAEPEPWDEPPPLWPHEWPITWLALEDGSWLAASSAELYHVDDETIEPVVERRGGFRYPADGPARTAALEYVKPFRIGERIVAWEWGGQRLLEFQRKGGEWHVHTLWAAPVEPLEELDIEALMDVLEPPPGHYYIVDYRPALDRVEELAALPEAVERSEPWLNYEPGSWRRWESRVLAWNLHEAAGRAPSWPPESVDEPPPETVEAVLEKWENEPWVDVAGYSLATWRLHHLHSLEIVEEAVDYLMESSSPGATYALALLRVDEARSHFEALIRDTTERGWASGCTYPRAEVGVRALQHVAGGRLYEVMPLSEEERDHYVELARSAAEKEGMDAWCGPGGHARWLLEHYPQVEP